MRFLTEDELLPDGWWYLGEWGASSGRRGLESHHPENRKLIWHMAQTQRKPHKSESRMHCEEGDRTSHLPNRPQGLFSLLQSQRQGKIAARSVAFSGSCLTPCSAL